MALLTRNASSCGDTYSLFSNKDKPFYGISYLDRSRTSIPTDSSSLFEKARSFYEGANIELTVTTVRTTQSGPPSIRPSTKGVEVPEDTKEETTNGCLAERKNDRVNEDGELSDYEEDFLDAPAVSTCLSPDEGSFVTAPSVVSKGPLRVPSLRGSGKRPYVFNKWLSTLLGVKAKDRTRMLLPQLGPSMSTNSSADASSDIFVCAVRSASVTMASYTDSVHSTKRHSANILDLQTIERMSDRKHVLEELISTEEYYIRDLKALRDHYIPVLREFVWISAETRQSMARNVSEMLDLHGRLLSEIIQALPCTAQTLHDHSQDSSRHIGHIARCGILADPSSAAEVAKVFETSIMGFFVYEEYSAKYEEVSKAPKRSSKGSELYEKGVESLAGASNSWDNRGEYGKRAMELSDMLFKPIQRLCKYPLLFRDIEKFTPAMDCPNTNRLVEKVLHRLEEQVQQVNNSHSDTPKARERIEKTWMLQDRLEFNHKADFPARLLGHLILCGTAHVVWQNTREHQPRAEYMACFLFKSYLILASVPKPDHYKVRFAITLAVAHVEEANHGKGLYSPGAPYSWKVVFEADHRIHEVLLSACSDEEVFIWRSHLQDRITAESRDYQEYTSTNVDFCAYVPADIKSIGGVFGRPGTLARHQSLHRLASASGLESDGQYIMINNLLSVSDPTGSEFATKRSHSTPNFSGLVPVINLKRSERNRVESRIADLWTKDIIPFHATRLKPRGEPNAAMIMKRLSMLSLGLSNPKKSGHIESSDHPFDEDDEASSHIIRRTTTSSFTTKSKTSSHPNRSAPSSPTKRSSSLSSRFSFSSNSRKGSPSEKSVGSSKRRSLRPILDGKWRSSTTLEPEAVIVEAPGGESSPAAADHSERWDRAGGYFPIVKPATPPNSFQEEEMILAVRENDFVNIGVASGRRAASTRTNADVPEESESVKSRPKLSRRHTLVVPPRHWRSVRRKRPKAASDCGRPPSSHAQEEIPSIPPINFHRV